MGRLILSSLVCVMAACPVAVIAEQSNLSESKFSQSAEISADLETAKLWGLDADEWKEYKTVMRGPRGIWSPNLDPITVLGIHADSDNERDKWAERLAKVERERVEKELAFEKAYQRAQKRLYGHIPLYRIDTPVKPVKTSLSMKRGVYDVWLTTDCDGCNDKVSSMMREGHQVHLFFVNADRAKIKDWAVSLGITPAQVKAKEVTLNIGEKDKQPSLKLPAIQERK